MTCIHCQHMSKPGRSDGYCAAREDLPLAYGERHPLHKLPDDNGEQCSQYETSPAHALGETMRAVR